MGCGTPVTATARDNHFQRKTKYEGELPKCPNCGETLKALVAICPACGHEISSKKIVDALRAFTHEIAICDRQIAESPVRIKTGWSSWGNFKRVCWLVLNVVTFGIPMVIYLVLPLLGVWGSTAFSAAEKRKVAAIKNFAFPNERESVLEILLFIKSQVSFIASEKIDRNSVHWASIWGHKAEQIFQKTEILFKGDVISNNAYNDFLAKWKKVKMAFGVRVIIAVVLIGAIAIFAASRGAFPNIIDSIPSVTLGHTEPTFEWPNTELANMIPIQDTTKGRIWRIDGDSLWIEVHGLSISQYEAYIAACKESGFSNEATRNGNNYTAYNETDGFLALRFIDFSSTDTQLKIELEVPPSRVDVISWELLNLGSMLPMEDTLAELAGLGEI